MFEILSNVYPWVKTLHILAVVSWMAGLLYLPRLFVNHVENAKKLGASVNVFVGMERRLLRIIMRPAMLATWFFGVLLAFTPGIVDWSAFWPYLKFASVFLLTGFHGWLTAQQKLLARGSCLVTARRFRLLNEVPTFLMVIIVIMIVVQPF
jgi:putative membrane protein